MKKRKGILLDMEGERAHQILQFYVGRQFLDHVTLERKLGTDGTRSYVLPAHRDLGQKTWEVLPFKERMS